MAAIGLTEASRLTGKNTSTLHRAMKTGRLSYTINDAGERRIELAELERVFGRKPNGAIAAIVQSHITQEAQAERVIAAQRLTIEQQDATIRDLRTRLDREVDERRALIALLTDRRSWWRRWFR